MCVYARGCTSSCVHAIVSLLKRNDIHLSISKNGSQFTVKYFRHTKNVWCFDNACELIGNFVDCYYEWLHCHSTQWSSGRSLAESQSTSRVEIDYAWLHMPFAIAENKLTFYLVGFDIKVEELFAVRFFSYYKTSSGHLSMRFRGVIIRAVHTRTFTSNSNIFIATAIFSIWFAYFYSDAHSFLVYAPCMMCFYFVSFRFVCLIKLAFIEMKLS